jgi:hypothetical protein
MIKYFSLKQEKKAEADAAAAAGTAPGTAMGATGDGAAARPAKKTKAAHIRVQKGACCVSAAALRAPRLTAARHARRVRAVPAQEHSNRLSRPR